MRSEFDLGRNTQVNKTDVKMSSVLSLTETMAKLQTRVRR